MRNFISEGKIKKKAKHKHDKALRSEAIQLLNDSFEMDEIEDSIGLEAPSYIGPMDGCANKKIPEIMKGKGKKVDPNDVVQKERILACHKFISRWAYKIAIPFHALEDDSFKMMLEVVDGQFGIGLPPSTRYSFSGPLLKHKQKEEIMKALGGNEKDYNPIIDIINHKMKDFDIQRQVVMIDLPKYKENADRFGVDLAIKGCMVNNADFDPAIWWGLFGGSTPHLKSIALTSSSSGCERN
ncbi:unnamed protein product [Lactuca saligna]|uniref:Uncharacterized protein n=1 Tax=Lactuca saligna TaxID=75948 RepID=A0AA35V7V3_LACSI|nr:unnamed protein product [Lactuca saligna]